MLQKGNSGSEVRELQEKLIARGYSCGAYGADGDFGDGTYNAVCAFQRDHGLAVDGIVGPETMNALIGSAGTQMLRLGSNGPLVRELQQKLIAKGYSCGDSGADGDFGQGTFNAVCAFQASAGLSADGIVGPATWEALNGFNSNGLLKIGDNGQEVRSLQQKLIGRGYNCGPTGADGDFGISTYNAVCAFQRDHGLQVDGIVGPATWAVLGGVDNSVLLRLGSKGDAVRTLQEKLIAKGYSCGPTGADGDFGQGTYNAVIQLQAAYGLEQDGIVGPLTWDALNSSTYTGVLKMGSKGDQVKRLQQMLINLGYNLGAYGADGDFGQSTYNAVCAFQSSRGLQVDGIVGNETWNALCGGSSSHQLLKMGASGDEVRRLQELLIAKGYSCGDSGADGDFGQATYDAVCAFQKANGLSVDGIVGSQTWNALYGFNGGSVNINGSAGVARFLEVAKSQLGVTESYKNMTKYGAWYGFNGVAWCAMFVSWCANQAGILGGIVPRYKWCESGANWYRARGRYRTRTSGYRPLPGDVIFFSRGGDYYHTGIVEYVSGNEVHTVEGNAADAVRRRTYSLSFSEINGYGANGGTVASDDDVLKKAGCSGMLKNHNVKFPGFSQEVVLGYIGLNPLIRVSTKASYQPVIASGKIYQVGSLSPETISAEVMNKYSSVGIETNLRNFNLADILRNININFNYGDILKYTFSMKSFNCLEITIEFKMKCLSKDLYQAIIIRIETLPNGRVEVPMTTSPSKDYTTELVVMGLITLGIIGYIVASGGTGIAISGVFAKEVSLKTLLGAAALA